MNHTKKLTSVCLLAASLGWTASTRADLLVSFPFNEGSGSNVTDTAQGLVGWLGWAQNPTVDTVSLMPFGPSGDNCLTTTGAGFLMVDDSNNPFMAITNGPITMEAWVYVDPYAAHKRTEGVVAYGSSYKLGLNAGKPVFTLVGIVDITPPASASVVAAGTWVHIAAAWQPGVGVTFHYNSESTFATNTTALAARPPLHNWLSLGAENEAANFVGSLDRIRIHNAVLTADQLDNVPGTPRAPLASTIVSYGFNEAAFPSQNAVGPAPRPTVPASQVTHTFSDPQWTSDSPTGLPGDFALAFNTNLTAFRERVQVSYDGAELIPLGANNTNYSLEAWVKLPTSGMEDRRVIFRGPTNAPRAALSVSANRTMHTTLFGNKDFDSPVAIPNDGRWHHLAVVMEDYARMKFYLDGIHRFTTNRVATGAANSNAGIPNLLIGMESDTRFFQGTLDRVRIHNNALTAEQLDFPAVPGMAIVTAHPTDAIADAGGTAQFTAAVSSTTAATYQWHYRKNRADQQSTPLPGQTAATLNLNAVTDADQGFYSLKIQNNAGVSESYGGRLMVRSGSSFDSGGFEAPKYVSGNVEDQDFWSNDQHGNTVRVQTAAQIEATLTNLGLTAGETVHSGSQALLFHGAGLATTSVRPILGFENKQNVTIDFWARPLTRGNSTVLVTNNTFITVENAAGTRAAAIRFGPSQVIDYNSANGWKTSGLNWQPNTWYRFTMRLDYAAKTYDVLVDGAKVNAAPLPFYFNASDKFEAIRVYRGSNQAGMIMDDLTVSVTALPVQISDISITGQTVTIKWQGGSAPFQLQRRSSLSSGNWENVGGTVTASEATDTVVPGGMFYRVQSN